MSDDRDGEVLYRSTRSPALEVAGCRCSMMETPHRCTLHPAGRYCRECRPVQGILPYIQGGEVGWLAHQAVIHNRQPAQPQGTNP